MPFDLTTATPVKEENADGVYELGGQFDINSAKPIEDTDPNLTQVNVKPLTPQKFDWNFFNKAVAQPLGKENIESVVKPFIVQSEKAAEAFNSGVAGFSQRLDAIAQYASDKLGIPKIDIFKKAAEVYLNNAEFWHEKAAKNGVGIIDEIVGSAVGGAIPGIAEFIAGVPYSVITGAAEAHKEGKSEIIGAVNEGLKRAVLGKLFEIAGTLKQPLASIVNAGVFGTQTATEGGTPEEIAKSAAVGALYGLGGKGQIGIKDIVGLRERPAESLPKVGETVKVGDKAGVITEVKDNLVKMDLDGKKVVTTLDKITLPEPPKQPVLPTQEAPGEAISPGTTTGKGIVDKWQYGAELAAAIPGEPIAFFGASKDNLGTAKVHIIYDEIDNQPLGYKIVLANGQELANPKSDKIGGSPYFETLEEAQKFTEQKLSQPTGESGQINAKMIPGVTEVAETLQKAHEAFTETLTPYNKGEEGKFTAATLRENLGKMVRSHDKVEMSLSKAKDVFEKAKPEANIDFMDKIEQGEKQADPKLQGIADTLRTMLDNKRKEVQDLGTGKLENFIENYFPHIWEDPQKATDVIRKIMGKRPLQGPKSFLKQRTIDSIKVGIEAGLKPVSYNPIDLVMLKIREMDRYLMAHRTINALKEQDLVKFVKVGDRMPEGFVKINDSIADVYSKGTEGEIVVRGKYYAQENAARILNNYLSPGLRGNFLYDIYRGAGNTLNQFQLGLSAFHLGFTSMDATVSKFALGINKLSRGDILGAGKEFIKAPLAPITNFIEGRKLLQSWYGKDNGEMTNIIADTMATAGGRAKMDKFYSTKGMESLKKSLEEGKILTATLKVPWMLVSEMSKPIMEYIVPRQKLGVFADLVKMELERNPDISHVELRDLAQKAWDSVDNRMGQLVYDNLFWNKVTKDLSMASVRSLGWNLGTFRELGGAGKDTIQMLNNFRQGKNSEFTYRMAYALALPIVAGLYGAVYHYLHTGKAPEELKDYYFPKTGALDKNGEPARISLPTYMKDIYHYTKAPVRTVLNKFNPVNNAVLQMMINKDFYGTEIRNADDPAVQQVLSELKFVGTQFIPFGIRNLQRDTRKTVESKVEPFVGITPAPYDVNMTKAEFKAQEYVRAKLPVGARTQESATKSKMKADLRNEFQVSQDKTAINQARQEGKITLRESRDIIKNSKIPPLERYSKNLTVYELANVIKVATEEEKLMLLKEFKNKYRNKYYEVTSEEKLKLKELKKKVLGE
jgi:hypothetical protein